MKINNFQGDLNDISSKNEAIFAALQHRLFHSHPNGAQSFKPWSLHNSVHNIWPMHRSGHPENWYSLSCETKHSYQSTLKNMIFDFEYYSHTVVQGTRGDKQGFIPTHTYEIQSLSNQGVIWMGVEYFVTQTILKTYNLRKNWGVCLNLSSLYL